MSFIIDRQTLDDLSIFGRPGRESVYALFNTTHTRGGARRLEEMFKNPLSDAAALRKRAELIAYLRDKRISFPFRSELFDTIEQYLSNTDVRTQIAAEDDTLQRKLKNYLGADTVYEELHKGILACIRLVNQTNEFMTTTDIGSCDAYREEGMEIRQLISAGSLEWMYREKDTRRLEYSRAAVYDRSLRYVVRGQILKLLQRLYELDVYISVAGVAEEHHLVTARVVPDDENILHLEGMFHPLLEHPVANNLDISPDSNFIFLTGANMAGKSTLMKTFGICIFLAHVGFPVPAAKMEFSVQDGLFTTINLPDNLNMGYSHFYAEVLRVKKVAQEVGRSHHLVVIFDELFRGTNVKDAYDATVAITEAFAEKRDCTFMISTHIIEAGETLRAHCDNINFVYLPTQLKGSVPVYPYKLTPGITNDRHGMMIIRNEGILDILKKEK